MDNDDHQVGRVLSRREALMMLGTAGLAAITSMVSKVAASSPVGMVMEGATALALPDTTPMMPPLCIVRPQRMEGPFFVDEMLNRRNIRYDPSDGSMRPGTLLRLVFKVSQISNGSCSWLPEAQVDVWHCDADGLYSDVPQQNTVGRKFLRGYQLTDTNGQAQFLTIYPGWYPGRTVHIHFKIRLNDYEFTSQLFFDDLLTDQVYLQEPYASRGPRDTFNSEDGIYLNSLVLNVVQTSFGYTAIFYIGVQMD